MTDKRGFPAVYILHLQYERELQLTLKESETAFIDSSYLIIHQSLIIISYVNCKHTTSERLPCICMCIYILYIYICVYMYIT